VDTDKKDSNNIEPDSSSFDTYDEYSEENEDEVF